jgi:hypothetical protein
MAKSIKSKKEKSVYTKEIVAPLKLKEIREEVEAYHKRTVDIAAGTVRPTRKQMNIAFTIDKRSLLSLIEIALTKDFDHFNVFLWNTKKLYR